MINLSKVSDADIEAELARRKDARNHQLIRGALTNLVEAGSKDQIEHISGPLRNKDGKETYIIIMKWK